MAEASGTRISWLALVLVAFSCARVPAYARYGGGTGAPNDPYLIYTPEQMNAIGAEPNDWGKHFQLRADIDLSEYPDRSFNIIGSDAQHPFTGTFDGNGHAILNFRCVSPQKESVGLFGHIDNRETVIENLKLVAPEVRAENARGVGGLVGGLGDGRLVHCTVEGGYISGSTSVGGLVGGVGGIVHMCSATCTVTGRSQVGGLAGGNSGTITSSFSHGDVSGYYEIGGLVGDNFRTITNCYSLSSVRGEIEVGGLLGSNGSGGVYNCYAAGSNLGTGPAGGLIGANGGGCCDRGDGTVSNSFWDVEASGCPKSSRGTGKTTREMGDPATFRHAGWAFVGDPNVGPNYEWAQPPEGGYPVLWWQLSPLPPLPAFSGGTGTPGDPYLIASEDQLNSIGHHPRLMEACFRLTNDIDLTGHKFFMMGSGLSPFRGVFDGDGHAICGFACKYSGAYDVGLFACIDGVNTQITGVRVVDPNVMASGCYYVAALVGSLGTGTVRDCHVEGGHVVGARFTGGLVGVSAGRVLECSASSEVEGWSEIGGLIGQSQGRIQRSRAAGTVVAKSGAAGGLVGYHTSGTIAECMSSASASGSGQVGGLVGVNTNVAEIADSYAEGSVWANHKVGGLVGENDGLVINTYARGSVGATLSGGGLIGSNIGMGHVYASWWDIQASGQSGSAGGTGRSTAEMQTGSTFAGWGCDGAWVIDAGRDYPRLTWENTPGARVVTPPFASTPGAGSEDDPYLISTAEQLNEIGMFPCTWNKHYRLMADIDLGSYTGTQFNLIGWWRNYAFDGVFDGNGHTIRNLTYTQKSGYNAGLFRYVTGANAVLKNLGLIDPVISIPGGSHAGALAANLEDGSVINCFAEGGSISTGAETYTENTGGLIGVSSGVLSHCHAATKVVGHRRVGGLVGATMGGRISDCYCAGDVWGDSYTGGLVGEHGGGTMSHCDAAGHVSGGSIGGLVGMNGAAIDASFAATTVVGGYNVGGFAAYTYGRISQCFSAGSVSGTGAVGGFAGWNAGVMADCYSTGKVSAQSNVGGLAGINTGTIDGCFAAGLILATGSRIGGVVGSNGSSNDGQVCRCLWDSQASGVASMCGLQESTSSGCDNTAGKTTAEMYTASTFLEAGWDFAGETGNGTEDIWWVREGQDYPRLSWEGEPRQQ